MSVPTALILFAMMLGPGGNELLDYIPSQPYWKLKNVTPTADNIAAELMAIKAGDTSKATQVRKLMALRTLGEMQNASVVPMLQAFADANEPFVADYARRALATAKGQKIPPRLALPPPQLANELGLLPVHCSTIVQLSERGDASSDPNKLLADFPLEPGQDRVALADAFTKRLVDLAERIGNVRVDSATFGLSDDVTVSSGYFVINFRGQLDAGAMNEAMKEIAGEPTDVDGKPVYRFGPAAAVFVVSDARVVLVSGIKREKLPLSEIAGYIKANQTAHVTTQTVMQMLKQVDMTNPMWGVCQVSPAYQESPLLTDIEALRLTALKDGRGLALELRARGRTNDAAQNAMDAFLENISHLQAKLHIASTNQPVVEPMDRLRASVRGERKDVVATLTAAVHASPAELYRMAMMFDPPVNAAAQRMPRTAATQPAPR